MNNDVNIIALEQSLQAVKGSELVWLLHWELVVVNVMIKYLYLQDLKLGAERWREVGHIKH